jgi:hypothetical protein
MNNILQIHNKTFEIEYYPATVLQSDKYEEQSPFSNNSWAFIPKHDIAFRLKDTNREFFFTTEYSRTRAYVGQEVALITINKKIIGFLSTTSNDYYFLTNKFAKIIGFGINWKWILVLEALIALNLFIFTEQIEQQYIVLTLFIIPFIYLIGMRLYNLYLERKIDRAIQDG